MKLLNAVLYQLRIISLPWWIAIGAAAALLFLLRHRREQLVSNLLIVYLLVILSSTLLSRSGAGGRSFSELLNLDLVGTWTERLSGSDFDRCELLLNFFMLVPFGILFPWATGKGLLPTVLCGALLTVVIETAQILSGRGWFELADIVDNVIGVLVGYGLYRLGARICRACRSSDR